MSCSLHSAAPEGSGDRLSTKAHPSALDRLETPYPIRVRLRVFRAATQHEKARGWRLIEQQQRTRLFLNRLSEDPYRAITRPDERSRAANREDSAR